MRLWKMIACALLLALMTACPGGNAEPTPTGSLPGSDPNCPTEGGEVAPDPRPASTATIKVVSPKQGERIVGDSVVVKVTVTGACILQAAQTAVRPDTGHVHISLQRPNESEYQTITLLAGSEFTVPDLKPGKHTFLIEFSAADHNPFNPRVTRTVVFRVVPA